jgi:4-coumarate--CoA ligase (photoactive yellow protein activation family)
MSVGLPRFAVHRIACAVVAAEVKRLRMAGAPLAALQDWAEAMPIGDDGVGLDSIEQLGALGALAETFELDDSTLGQESPDRVGAWIDWIMRGQIADKPRLIVRTSGSTGTPSTCRHAVADLVDEARFLATQIAGRRRVVALVPAHHLYGIIWTAFLPAVMDIPVVVRTLGAPLDLAIGDLVVAVPDQWRMLSRLIRTFPDDVVGISSAAPLDNQLGLALLASGLSRMFDIYGSSETGGIAMRELSASAYALLPRWQLAPYGLGDWQLTDQDGRHHALPDHVERIGDRSLCPIKRRDSAVQVGGHNVWPARVAGVLRRIDGVADAAVRLHADGRLKAFIVPNGDRDPDELALILEGHAADRLSVPERPRHLRFGAALPRNAMGKLEDWS